MPSNHADASQSFDLPLRGGDGLRQEQSTAIEDALRKYRNRVLEINMAKLETAISDIETREIKTMEFWPKTPKLDPEELPQRRVERLEGDYGVRLEHPQDPSITSIRDFLSEDRRGNLVRSCRLDGVVHGEVDIEALEAWIEKTEEQIRTAERTEIHLDGLPAELKYLMTLIRGICGNGLPAYRYSGQLRQMKFITDIEGEETEGEEPRNSGFVTVPRTDEEMSEGHLGDIQGSWDDHVVALAAGIGNGGFAVYCRKQEDADGAIGWRWKYGLWDPEFKTALYDTVEEFLEFYADFDKEGGDDPT
ncbi:hypothetical protein CLAFUR4_13045 [Fulvia fulva]|nr:hypothetical protein CLAFUR4_13045 [Fulvia fulva]